MQKQAGKVGLETARGNTLRRVDAFNAHGDNEEREYGKGKSPKSWG